MVADILLGAALGGLIVAKILDPSKFKEYRKREVEAMLVELSMFKDLVKLYQDRLSELEREVDCFVKHTDRGEVLKCLQRNDHE